MSSGTRTAGELQFEEYIAAHKYDVLEHEPDLGVEKRPDYLVVRDGHQCVCEVKEFSPETSSIPWTGGTGGTTSMEVVLKPIRHQIRSAAKQLKPLADRGLPLVVVITNPHGAMVTTDDQEVIWAMYGDPVVRFAINRETGGAEGDAVFTVDRNGKLRGDHQYISALVFVRHRELASDFYGQLLDGHRDLPPAERYEIIMGAHDRDEVPEGSYHRVDVFKTLSRSAVALPESLFDGPRDRLFDYDAEAEMYKQVRGPTF